MSDLTVSSDFLARISTLGREEKLRALYCRVMGLTEEDIRDIPLEPIEEQLQSEDHRYFYDQVLSLDETYTI